MPQKKKRKPYNKSTGRNYDSDYKKFGKSKKARAKRAALNRANRKRKTYGNGDGKDLHHTKSGKLRAEPASKNRGRREKSRLKGSKRKKR